jgi:hypothetical protein
MVDSSQRQNASIILSGIASGSPSKIRAKFCLMARNNPSAEVFFTVEILRKQEKRL